MLKPVLGLQLEKLVDGDVARVVYAERSPQPVVGFGARALASLTREQGDRVDG